MLILFMYFLFCTIFIFCYFLTQRLETFTENFMRIHYCNKSPWIYLMNEFLQYSNLSSANHCKYDRLLFSFKHSLTRNIGSATFHIYDDFIPDQFEMIGNN